MEDLEDRIRELGIFSYLVGLALLSGIALAGFYAINGCNREVRTNQEVRKNEEVNMPSPFDIREFTKLKTQALGRLEVDKKFNLSEEYNREKAEEYDKIIQRYGEEIRTRIEKGVLTPQNAFYEGYKDIYGNEPWWPKDKTGSKDMGEKK